jgi:hypothetical protein
VALGDSDLALRQLERLLADELRVYGDDDSRVTDLREQIGLLLHGIGRTPEAVRALEQLASDLELRHGPENPDVRSARKAIRRMKKN